MFHQPREISRWRMTSTAVALVVQIPFQGSVFQQFVRVFIPERESPKF